MGFWEIFLILVIALIVISPQKLPEIAKEMGKGIRWLKKSYVEFKVALTKDINENDTTGSLWNKKKS